MTGDHVALGADQDGIAKTKRADAPGDFRDLACAVGAGVARVWDQPIELPILNPQLFLRLPTGLDSQLVYHFDSILRRCLNAK